MIYNANNHYNSITSAMQSRFKSINQNGFIKECNREVLKKTSVNSKCYDNVCLDSSQGSSEIYSYSSNEKDKSNVKRKF